MNLPRNLRSLALLTAICTAAGAAGCSSSSSSKPQANGPAGLAKVGVTIKALTAAQVVKLTLTVGPGTGTPSFTPIVTDLTNNDPTNKLTWTALVQSIPAGAGRTFDVKGYDAGNNVLYSGSTIATIVAGSTANVYLVLQEQNAPGYTESLPVVDSLTSSANLVTIGTPPPGPVSLYFKAHDPVAGATMTYSWSDTCGATSFTNGSGPVDPAVGNTAAWTPPTSVPPAGACTLSLTITDDKQGSVTAYLAILVQANTNGSALVSAYPNSWPMIAGVTVAETFTKNASGQIVAVDVDLTATASDADGDDVTYAWSSPNCSGSDPVGFTATTPLVASASATLAYGPGQIGSSTVHFHGTDLTSSCIVQLAVTDSWKNGIVPLGSGLPVARGGDTVATVNLSAPRDFLVGPQITQIYAPGAPVSGTVTPASASYTVQNGQTVSLGIDVLDPTPGFATPETPFTFAWTQTGGSFVASSEVDNTASPGKTVIQWSASNPYAAGSTVKVAVTNKDGLQATYTWNFVPANPCDGSAASVGVACDTGLGLCAPNGHCTAGGTCVSATPVVCSASDQCHAAGVCDPSSGQCTNPAVTNGTACNADASGCTFNDSCQNGTCTAGTAVTCAAPADAQCQSAAGACVSTGNNSYTCSYASLPDGTACNNDNNGCTQNDSCQAGSCTAGAAVACSQSTNTCQASTGACTSTGANTYTCAFANLSDGTACNTAGACVSGQTCTAGTCAGGTSACPANDSCSVSNNQPVCSPTGIAPQVAKDLQVSPPSGLSMDTSGNAYLGAGINSMTGVSFDGHSVTSTGDYDIFVAKYDASGANVWAVGYGDALSNSQIATGTAVTADGTVAVIGSFSGNVTIGNPISSSNQIDFLAAVRSSNGSGLWAKQFNDGSGGILKSVAANPGDASAHGNRIAVCGIATQSATDLVAGATYGGLNDIVIAVYTSSGSLLWSQQIGTAGNEECDAVAVDDNGDVYAAGKFDGASLTIPGTTALAGPNSSIRKFIWVAKFNGATGAGLASAAFGGSVGQAGANSVAAAPGILVVGGNFTSSVPFGGTTLTSAGGTDAYVAGLDPTSLAVTWAERLGGTGADAVNGVAVTSYGDVLATGIVNKSATIAGTTASATTVTASSTTAADAFVWKINGLTGGTDFAAPYGDIVTQTGDAVAVNRFAATNQVALVGTLNGSVTFPAPAGTISATGATDVFFTTAKLQ
jgi:hypothetical protein